MRPVTATALLALLLAAPARAAEAEPLVDIAQACPGIQIELRYATPRNLTGKPLYPPQARALLRPNVAVRLNRAHRTLQARGFGLKVWDAYRPEWAQRALWNAVRNRAFVVEPGGFGSLHSWGAAVDVTLVDFGGREVRMPTDFDDFTPAARYAYNGGNDEIAANLKALKYAMAEAGFRHIRDEWWHYSVTEGLSGQPPNVRLDVPASGETAKDKAPSAEEWPKPTTKPAPAAPKSSPRPARLPSSPRPKSTL